MLYSGIVRILKSALADSGTELTCTPPWINVLLITRPFNTSSISPLSIDAGNDVLNFCSRLEKSNDSPLTSLEILACASSISCIKSIKGLIALIPKLALNYVQIYQ